MAQSIDLTSYPVRLSVDYPKKLSRWKTFLRAILIIPIYMVFSLLVGNFDLWFTQSSVPGETLNESHATYVWVFSSIFTSFFFAIAALIVIRNKYPRWWFDFIYELSKFSGRICAYGFLLTDVYPSTDEEQGYHLEIDYPDVVLELNRWLPLFKWLLAIPHYLILFFLGICMFFSVVFAWIAILITGRYPRPLFNFVVGTMRWSTRTFAYAFLLVTDRYPPFSLK